MVGGYLSKVLALELLFMIIILYFNQTFAFKSFNLANSKGPGVPNGVLTHEVRIFVKL